MSGLSPSPSSSPVIQLLLLSSLRYPLLLCRQTTLPYCPLAAPFNSVPASSTTSSTSIYSLPSMPLILPPNLSLDPSSTPPPPLDPFLLLSIGSPPINKTPTLSCCLTACLLLLPSPNPISPPSILLIAIMFVATASPSSRVNWSSSSQCRTTRKC